MKKNIVNILTCALLGLSTLMVSCGGDSSSADANQTTNVASEMAFLRAEISGMTCAVGCAKTIEKMLSETEGVESVEVNFEKEAAFINYDKSKVSEADLLKAISEFKDGAYSAKKSDKDCKTSKDCKKKCCAKKDAVKEVKEAANETKEAISKEVEKVNHEIKRSTTTTVKTLDAKATKAVTEGKKAIDNAADKATQELEAKRKEAVKNAVDIKESSSKEAKDLSNKYKKITK